MRFQPSHSPAILLVTLATVTSCFAFSPNATLSALPSNTALDLGAYRTHCADSTDDEDNCRRYGDYSRFTYDPEHHQILFFGGGHSTTMRDDIDVFTFEDLSWKSAYKSTTCDQMTSVTPDGAWSSTGHPVARHTYDQLIYAPNTHGLFITSPVYGAGYCGTYDGCGEWCAGKMFRYDPELKTWNAKTTATNRAHVWSSEYDPISGMIVSVGRYGLTVYDPVADVKTEPLSSSPIETYADNLVYFPPNDKFYYISRGDPVIVHEVALNRTTLNQSTITEVTGMTEVPQTRETGWAYDSANSIIGGGIANGIFYAFDPTNKSWTSREINVQEGNSDDLKCYYHCFDYDPVDGVFIMYAEDFHTWAYCYKRGNSNADLRPFTPTRMKVSVSKQGPVVTATGFPDNGIIHLLALNGSVAQSEAVKTGGSVMFTLPSRGIYLLHGAEGLAGFTKKIAY